MLRHLILLAPVAALLLGACTSTRILPMPESPEAMAAHLDGQGGTVVIHARRYATGADSLSEPGRVPSRNAPIPTIPGTTVYSRSSRGQGFVDLWRATEAPWDDVSMVSRVNVRSGRGAAHGLGYGALAGGLLGAAIGAMSYEPCTDTGFMACFMHPDSRGSAATLGLTLGALSGAVWGVVIGALSGYRETTEWRRQTP